MAVKEKMKINEADSQKWGEQLANSEMRCKEGGQNWRRGERESE